MSFVLKLLLFDSLIFRLETKENSLHFYGFVIRGDSFSVSFDSFCKMVGMNSLFTWPHFEQVKIGIGYIPSLVSPVSILETFRRITPSVNVWQPHCSQTIGFVFDKISVNSILFVFTFQRYYYFFEVPKKLSNFFIFLLPRSGTG